ncbi:MAG TPA: biopolymer transporter ExbD, partial [Sandaracinaceae bacterium]
MPIHTPGRVLLHHIPLKFVHDRVAGGGRKSVDVSIALIPFIDFLITLVVFLLTSFSATGELLAQRPN